MKLSELKIEQVRNIEQAQLQELADINIIYGRNGAGKTTVLESIHILALARSFRSIGLQPVIGRGAEACTVFGRIALPGQGDTVPVGVYRPRRGGFKIKLAGKEINSVVELAELIPLQMINAASYLLLDGGPKQRRQFLDWGVFHVEQGFYADWRRAQKAVKQRNAILRSRGNDQQLAPWNRELIDAASAIHRARRAYVEEFVPVFTQMLARLVDLDGIQLDYRPGWDADSDFAEVLQVMLPRDRLRGLTHAGPHRADLKVSVHGVDAAQILSRGQQKLVVSALRLAQTALLERQTGRRCIVLVDDLPAEMDAEHQRRLCKLLGDLDMQLFLTCIAPADLSGFDWPAGRRQQLFHVEHGVVEAC